MDPTYPFFPIMSLISAVLVLLVLINNAIRRSFNFGVFMICLGLFSLDITFGVNSIIWSDNADLRAPVWCDITSHVQLFGAIIVPAGSVVVTRRLYLIAKRKPIAAMEPREKRLEMIFECSLLLLLPALYISIFYYIVQLARFQILEGIGCTNAIWGSGASILLLDLPGLIPPVVSVLFYCPRILWTFYTQRREFKRFLASDSTASSERRNDYLRLLALGCLDIVLTLPINAIDLFLDSKSSDPFIFYPGWDVVHADWTPQQATREEWSQSPWAAFTIYFTIWSNVLLSIAMFGLFGFTPEALAVYKRGFFGVSRRFGRTPTASQSNPVSSVLMFRSRHTESEGVSVHAIDSTDLEAQEATKAGGLINSGAAIEMKTRGL